MRSITCDVLIIGGGATGAGVYFDLAQRGLKVALAEQNDLGTGTSGRYHGLLHSGARYVVRDPASAKECIEENRILRKIAPHAIEDTGGWFAAFPPDSPAYVDPWLKGCAEAGIPTEPVPVSQALREEPHLNPAVRAVYRVPDGSCDSWELIHALIEGAAAFDGQAFTYHRVVEIERRDGKVIGALLEDRRGGEALRVHTGLIVNAAGPWAGVVSALAGVKIGMSLSKGIMIAMNVRWTQTVINRLDQPGDGDILVPVGTVAVIGTTSVTVERPDDLRITPEEVTQMLDEGEVIIPAFRKARALRAWAGVRPLYDPSFDPSFDPSLDPSLDPGAEGSKPDSHAHDEHTGEHDDEGRFITRSFRTLDHADQGAAGMLSIVGGKLTTYRQMAEQIADRVCRMLGTTRPGRTAETALPVPAWMHDTHGRHHRLTNRLGLLESAAAQTGLICECELVTRPQLEGAIRQAGPRVSLDDLRRDLRLGMGPCQGGFCAYRAAGVLRQTLDLPPADSVDALRAFAEERFRGNRPLLWGHQLRQALLDEMIYRRSLGLGAAQAETHTDVVTASHTQGE